MTLEEESTNPNFADLTAGIVSSYVTNNSVQASDLPKLIGDVHRALTSSHAGTVEPKQEPLTPRSTPSAPCSPTTSSAWRTERSSSH